MNGKTIIDLAAQIVNRQESSTRSDILAFINSARLNVLRSVKMKRLQDYRTAVTMTSGVIDMTTQLIKSVRMIEYNNGTTLTPLKNVFTRQAAMDIYGDFTTTGTPTGYLEEGTKIYILPIPTTGSVNLQGEFWPADLTDSESSTDITTVDLGDAWAYLGVADYFAAKGDQQGKSDKWKKEGMDRIAAYVAETNRKPYDTTDAWRRWPFGVPLSGRFPATESDLDKGNW